MTSFFSAEGGPIWIKFPILVQNDMSTAVIWLKSKPELEFQYGGRLFGLTENDGPSKLQDMKLQDMKKTDQIAGHENAGMKMTDQVAWREIGGHEIARHETGGQTTEK